MAQRVVTQLVSDLSGEDVPDGKGESIAFSVRGIDYTIDLTDKEAASFDKAIATYVEHATKVSGRRTRKTASPSTRDYEPKAVREWAQQQGIDVPARGRIPAQIVEQYKTGT